MFNSNTLILAHLSQNSAQADELAYIEAALRYLTSTKIEANPQEILQDIMSFLVAFPNITGALLVISPSSPLAEQVHPHMISQGDMHVKFSSSELPTFLNMLRSYDSAFVFLSPMPSMLQTRIATSAPGLIIRPVGTPNQPDAFLLLSATISTVSKRMKAYIDISAHIIAHVFSVAQVTNELQTLLAATREMAAGDNLETVLHQLLRYAVKLTHTEAASILLQDPRTGKLTFRAAVGPHSELLRQMNVPLHSIAGQTFQQQHPIVVADTRQSPLHFRHVDETTGFETRSIMAVPIYWRHETIGVIEVINKRFGTFVEKDLDALKALATQAAALIEHARLAAQREEAIQRLKELDERKTQFMHLTSHELRTPLTIIRGYAEMLAEEVNQVLQGQMLPSVETWQLLVTEILSGTKRMASIVEEISHAVDIPKELPPSEVAEVNLHDVIDFVLSGVEEWVRTKSIDIEVNRPEEPTIVEGHWQHLKEAVSQIVNNAVKFTPPHGRVNISLWADDTYAYIQVTDTGPGIPLEEQERIFDSFYQVENALNRQHPGLGLGLTIARQAVEQHMGHIWVDSTPNKGSTFTIVLPKHRAHTST